MKHPTKSRKEELKNPKKKINKNQKNQERKK